MLREKSAGELSRPGHAPSDRRQAPGEQTRQCCLAVAVGAEQRDAVVGVEPQIEPRQHRFSRDIADRGPLERDQRRVQLRRIRKDDPRRRLFGRWVCGRVNGGCPYGRRQRAQGERLQ